MSTEPRTQAAFIQGKQSAVEHDPSHSALLYLFQEVSKLGSPVHSSFLDTHSTSTRLNETSRLGHFIVRREEEDAQSFSISNSSCQHTLTCLSPFNQVKKVKEEGLSSSVTILDEPQPECNSPWKVLSLINLQCERLLNPHDVVESDLSSVSSVAKVGDSLDNASASIAEETDHKTFLFERHKIQAGVSPRKDVTGVCSGGADRYKPQGCVNDSQMSCCAHSQTAEKTDTFRTEQVEEHATASSQPRYRDSKWDKFSLSRQLRWKQECKDRLSSERDTENVSVYALLPFNSKEETSTALSKPAPSLDHNANFLFTPQPKTDTQLPQLSSVLPSSQPASFLFATAEHFHSLSNQNDKIIATKPECLDGPVEEKSPPVAQLNSLNYNGDTNPAHSATSELESLPVQEKEIALPSTQQWRTKTPRKQRHPSRSADIQDPDFQGVTFRMDTELDDSKEQCRLLITSKYSKELCRSVRKPRLRTRTAPKFLKTSSSDEENDPTTSSSKSKVCASCCTRKTPMWRDAEDGTPLCNACGIRYKKYRVRCVNCWHIPRKESNSNSCCPKCGNFVKLTSAQRKHSA